MNFWLEALYNLLAYGAVLIAGGAVVLVLLWLRPGLRERFWPLQRLRKGAWTGLEVFLAFALFTQLGGTLRSILVEVGFFYAFYDELPSAERQILWVSPLMFFLVLALIFATLWGMSRTRPRHYGLSLARWPQNIVQGVLLFALATPAVLIVYGFLVFLFQGEQAHELQRIAEEGLWPGEWVLLGLLACVVAPVMEELLFRGLLQGWLRRASLAGHVMVCIWSLFMAAMPLGAAYEGNEKAPPLDVAWWGLGFTGAIVAVYAFCFYRVWKGLLREGPLYMMIPAPEEVLRKRAEVNRNGDEVEGDSEEDEEDEEEEPLLRIDPERWAEFERGNVRLSILGSAMLFAAMHGAWPSPIPLFILGLILGWLAYRTQSLIGTMTLHACFNAVAFGALFLSQHYKETNGNAETTQARPWDGGNAVTVVPASHEPLRK